MGEQAGAAVSGSLYYVPREEFARVRALRASKVEVTELFATLCRINTLYMIACAGSGHIGSSFSSLDMMSWLLLNEVRPAGSAGEPGDVFFSSKGHDAPGLYSVYLGLGQLEFDLIHRLRRIGGLPGHPDVGTRNMVTNTGSLGMGVSKAKGMIFARRLLQKPCRAFVLTGDGELQEGQFWESLVSAANHELHELTVIVDHNKMQSDTLVSKVSDLGDLEAKLESFGWRVSRCDGNDVAAFAGALAAGQGGGKKPKVIIADTIKGKGVSFMEHTAIDSDVELYKFHSGAPSDEGYVRAATELIAAANAKLAAVRAEPLTLERVERQAVPSGADALQRLIPAYSAALLDQAERNPKIVALDADLVLDTGLIPFQRRFPERFVECGIAEQDMVSQAGGMALCGLLPVVHSFACFLSARPNEQIYNNATERTKVVYVASLAGVVPGGPGHSHQAVRDIAALAAVPGLTLVEPSCDAEVGMLLDWCLNRTQSSSYLRLVSIPVAVPYSLPSGYYPREGCGTPLTEGRDVAVIGYGPVLLSAAYEAARQLAQRGGLSVKVINLPWLNTVDGEWLRREILGCKMVVTLDNHYAIGGQGDRIAAALLAAGLGGVAHVRVAVHDLPVCGANAEVLREHGLDTDGIVNAISRAWRA